MINDYFVIKVISKSNNKNRLIFLNQYITIIYNTLEAKNKSLSDILIHRMN